MRLVILIIGIILISGCTQQNYQTSNTSGNSNQPNIQQINKTPTEICIDKCKEFLSAGMDIRNGPCLLNPIENTTWVCDVAHNPRAAVDDNPQNQCSEYLKSASHFVEVTPNCEFIRAV